MLYRPTYTKPIPPGAVLFTRRGERFARWTNGRGKTKTAKLTTTDGGSERLVFTSPFWRFRYRDGAGVERDVLTGCRDEVAAQGVANELQRRAELVKAGTIKHAEDAAADHTKLPLAQHVSAYLDHLRAKGVTDTRYDHVDSWLRNHLKSAVVS